MPNLPTMNLQSWDEPAITRQLVQLRDQRPSLIPHFVESITERFIIRQDDHTAGVRLRFLKTQIEQLKLAKEFQQTIDDISLLRLEKVKRIKSFELEATELDIKKESLGRKERLEAMREEKKLELELAQIDQQIQSIKNSPKKEPVESQLTPEQKRAEEKRKCDARIAELKAQKQEALKLADEDERLMRVNAIDAAIQREYERWSKLL